MKALTKYNTLAEALAFNLTNKDIDDLGYFENLSNATNILDINKRLRNLKADGIAYTILNTVQRFSAQTAEYKDSFFEVENKDVSQMERIDTSSVGRDLISTDISLNLKNNAFSRFMTKDPKKTAQIDNLETWVFNNAIFVSHDSRLGDNTFPYFGDYSGENPFSFNSALFVGLTYLFYTNRINDEVNNVAPLTDFIWLNNKKIFTYTKTLVDNEIFDIANLIPNYTIGYLIRKDVYDEFVKDESTFKEKCKTIEGIVELHKKYKGTLVIFFRNTHYIHFFWQNCFIHDLFNYGDGEAYPTDKNGYIDFSKIDWRKTYTRGLGSANLNTNFLTKAIDTLLSPCVEFTNMPTDKQGKPFSINFTNTIFNKDNNNSTMTIELGYVEIDGKRYNDELVSVSSESNLLNIVDKKDGTYTISFKDLKVATDNILVTIKNTFTNFDNNLVYEMKFIEGKTELLSYYINPISTSVSQANSIKGFIVLERFNNISNNDVTKLNDKDINISLAHLSNFIKISSSKLDVLGVKRIVATNKIIQVEVKGKSYTKEQQYLSGNYPYTLEATQSKQKENFTITLKTDNLTMPIYNPVDGTNPGGGGNTGGGGSGGGGGGGFPWLPGRGGDDKKKGCPKCGCTTCPNCPHKTCTGCSCKGKTPPIKGEPDEPEEPKEHTPACVLPPTDGDYINLSDLFEFKTEVTENTKASPLPEPGDSMNNYGHDYQGGWIYWNLKNHAKGYSTNSPWLMPKHTKNTTILIRPIGSEDNVEWTKFCSMHSFTFLNSFTHYPKDDSNPTGEYVDKEIANKDNETFGDITLKWIISVTGPSELVDRLEKESPLNVKPVYDNNGDLIDVKIQYMYYGTQSMYGHISVGGQTYCAYGKRESEPFDLPPLSMLISEYTPLLNQLYNLPELLGMTPETQGSLLIDEVLGKPQWTLSQLIEIENQKALSLGWEPKEISNLGDTLKINLNKSTEAKQTFDEINKSLGITYTYDANKYDYPYEVQGALVLYEKSGDKYKSTMISEPINLKTNDKTTLDLNNLYFGTIKNATPDKPSVINVFDAKINTKSGFYMQFQANAYQDKLGATTHTANGKVFKITVTREKSELVEGSVSLGYRAVWGGSDGKQKQLEMKEKLTRGKGK